LHPCLPPLDLHFINKEILKMKSFVYNVLVFFSFCFFFFSLLATK